MKSPGFVSETRAAPCLDRDWLAIYTTRLCPKQLHKGNTMLQTIERDQGAQKIRVPLDHPETERLAKRITFLIFSGKLTEDECGQLIKKERDLRKVDYRLARRLFDAPIPVSPHRPMFWDDHRRPFSGVFCGDELAVWAGWVARLREYVERLERKYLGRAAAASDGDNDFI